MTIMIVLYHSRMHFPFFSAEDENWKRGVRLALMRRGRKFEKAAGSVLRGIEQYDECRGNHASPKWLFHQDTTGELFLPLRLLWNMNYNVKPR